MMSNILKWMLMAFGTLWGVPLLKAIDQVDPDLPLEDAKTALCNAIQGCHEVSGTVRGWLCSAIKKCKDQVSLALLVGQLVKMLEKYAPA